MHDSTIVIKKKKVHGGHAHHGGSWKVAYADFVTAMMAFFMVMWIMGLSDETKAQIQGYFNDPLGFMKNEPRSKTIISFPGMKPKNNNSKVTPLDTERASAQRIEKEIEEKLGSLPDFSQLMKQIEVAVTDEGLLIEFREAANAGFFESGSAILKPAAKKVIAQIAPFLGETGSKMVIAGHTDAKPYAGDGYTNWDLSSDRASSVRRELARAGIPNSRFAKIESRADTELLHPDKPFDAANRRVAILLPFRHDSDDTTPFPGDQARAEIAQGLPKLGPADVDLRGN